MTTELTLREKVLVELDTHALTPSVVTLDRIADLLSATGAPAYIRVADDLRGVVREEGDLTGNFQTDSLQEARRWANVEAQAIARYLDQVERGEGK